VTNADERSHRLAFARILAKWSAEGERDTMRRGVLAARLDRFQIAPSSDVTELLGRADPDRVDLYASRLWLRGPVVRIGTPPFVPVATAMLKVGQSGALEACIRVGLFFEAWGQVDFRGWRFESPDKDDDAAHPYPHAQHITEWSKDVAISLADTEPVTGTPAGIHVNERRPAFPLRGAETIAGLAAVTLASLYGAPVARQWLSDISRLGTTRATWEDVGASVS
jgi:hypothetical protein